MADRLPVLLRALRAFVANELLNKLLVVLSGSSDVVFRGSDQTRTRQALARQGVTEQRAEVRGKAVVVRKPPKAAIVEHLAAAWIRRRDDRRAACERLEVRQPEAFVRGR